MWLLGILNAVLIARVCLQTVHVTIYVEVLETAVMI